MSGLGPLDGPGAFDGMNATERRIMVLSRRRPVIAFTCIEQVLRDVTAGEATHQPGSA